MLTGKVNWMLMAYYCLSCCVVMAVLEENGPKDPDMPAIPSTVSTLTTTFERPDNHEIKKRQWHRPVGMTPHRNRFNSPRSQKTKRYHQSSTAAHGKPLPSIDNYYFPILLYRGPNRPLEPIPIRAPPVKIQYQKSKSHPRKTNHYHPKSGKPKQIRNMSHNRSPMQQSIIPAMDRSSQPSRRQESHRSNIEPPPQVFPGTRMQNLKDDDDDDDPEDEDFDEFDSVPVRPRNDRPRFVYTRAKYAPPRDHNGGHSQQIMNKSRFQQPSRRDHQQMNGGYGEQYEFENYEVAQNMRGPYAPAGRPRQVQKGSNSRKQRPNYDDYDYEKPGESHHDPNEMKSLRTSSSQTTSRAPSRNANVPKHRYSSNAPEYVRPLSNPRPRPNKAYATNADIENTYANFELHKMPSGSRTTKAPEDATRRPSTRSGRKMGTDRPSTSRNHRFNDHHSSDHARAAKLDSNDYYDY